MKTICVYIIIGFLLVPFLRGEKLQKEREVYETQYATSRVSTFVYSLYLLKNLDVRAISEK